MIDFDINTFKEAILEVSKAIESLENKKSYVNEILGITDAYEGKESVNDASLQIFNIISQTKELLEDMINTLNIMFKNMAAGSFVTLPYIVSENSFGTPSIMSFWTNQGEAQKFLSICGIVGGTKQGNNQCLATARMYAQLVCDYLGITSDDEDIRDGKVGYVFDNTQDALEYMGNEIKNGYPVTLEVTNGEEKKHFVMAFGLKLNENGQVPEQISENDILYLDPVAGEVKVLGESWKDYGLMARNLKKDSTASTPLGVKGYWVGTFSGDVPERFKERTDLGYQPAPKSSDTEINPYAPYDYYVSITLNDGTILNSRDFTNEELDKDYTLPKNQIPAKLPWINPNATDEDWITYFYNIYHTI